MILAISKEYPNRAVQHAVGIAYGEESNLSFAAFIYFLLFNSRIGEPSPFF